MPSSNCPNCDCSRYPGTNGHCPDCNYPPLRRLTLTGTTGTLSFGVRTRLGSTLLLKMSPEANYSEREDQFTVFCRDADWFIFTRPGTRNATILNGRVLKEETTLKEGDVITLGNATGSRRQVMRLAIGMVDA